MAPLGESTASESKLQPVLVGIDYGRKRIGVAVTTALGTVHPRPRVERTKPEHDFAMIRAVVDDVEASAVIIGLPHNMDGTVSAMELEVRAFAVELKKAVAVPIIGVDERLTSAAADSALRQQNLDGRQRKARKDSAAACLMLHDYLDQGKRGEEIA